MDNKYVTYNIENGVAPTKPLIKNIGFITAFEANYSTDFYFKGEYHDFWEIVVVLSGNIGVTSDENIYHLKRRDLIVHKPMEFHKLWVEGNKQPQLLIFSFKADIDERYAPNDLVLELSDSQYLIIEMLLEHLRTAAVTDSADNGTWFNFLPEKWNDAFSYKAAVLLELLLISLSEKSNIIETAPNPLYRNAVKILKENCESWISIDEVAGLCGVSSSHLKKIFAKYSDNGVHKYFLKLKLQRAMQLLDSGMTVSEVSERLHFNNPNYFGIVFKRETGSSPMAYKKHHLAATCFSKKQSKTE